MWRWALARVLAGDHHDPAAVAAYGGERLVRAGQDGDVGDGVLGVERPEPVARRADLVRGQVRPSIWSSGGPSLVVISSTGNSTPSSSPSTRSTAANPGTVSMSVMSRSKPTAS